MTGRRGRPRNADNPELAQVDPVIARTVGQLVWYGFPLRGESGVCATVARHAAEVLWRRDGRGLPLSADRVEQIYEAWKAQDFRRQWARRNFTKESLQARVPFVDGRRAQLEELTLELLRNGGRPRRTLLAVDDGLITHDGTARFLEDAIGDGGAELTPKAQAEILKGPYIGKRGN